MDHELHTGNDLGEEPCGDHRNVWGCACIAGAGYIERMIGDTSCPRCLTSDRMLWLLSA